MPFNEINAEENFVIYTMTGGELEGEQHSARGDDSQWGTVK